jgi:glutamate N-acetyltransferase/amino-acid N-acetyltransferase
VIACDVPATAAALFTTNRVQAAPVQVSKQHLESSRGRMRAIVVNSGNANCCTGAEGRAVSRSTARALATLVGCRTEEIFVCSTGVIGVPLPVERIVSRLPRLASRLESSAAAFADAAHAIMTTDTRPKWAAVSCRIDGKRVWIAGCAKGAGMIHPHMATMLGFLLTDAAVPPALLRRALREATSRTFNTITVDGDTSTNDTVVIFASGASGARLSSSNGRSGSAYDAFAGALEKVCGSLALQIVADGEGAQRVVEIEVRGAPSDRSADQVARTIANSSLVKTALAGADPNWGRILAAAGRAGVKFNPEKSRVTLAGIPVFRRGRPLPFNERVAHKRLLREHVPIVVDLGAGRGSARVWTCDLTTEYVHINASYRT